MRLTRRRSLCRSIREIVADIELGLMGVFSVFCILPPLQSRRLPLDDRAPMAPTRVPIPTNPLFRISKRPIK